MNDGWGTTEVNPLALTLDSLNPRIEVEEDASPQDIIETLVKYEDVAALARKIRDEGLLPGERIIITQENGRAVVLEGNRRSCACQLLLNPGLIPKQFVKSFPRIQTATQSSRIELIPVDVAPSRGAAEKVLTLRHVEPAIRKWTVPAKIRRASRLLERGLTLDEIAEQLGEQPAHLRKTVRSYRLFKLALGISSLTSKEKEALSRPDLKINPYTRLFELEDTKQRLGLSFDENLEVQTTLSKSEFDRCLKKIVRAILIPYALEGKSNIDTRARISDILSEKDGYPPEKNKKAKAVTKKLPRKVSSGRTTGGPQKQENLDRKPDRFFENLQCEVEDTNIRALTEEIRKIEPALMPISGTLLLRSLLEAALRFQIKKAGVWGQLVKDRKDPNLGKVVNFCISNSTIFKQDRPSKVLKIARDQELIEYMNMVAHGEWVSADRGTLESCANHLRSLIQHILLKDVETAVEWE
jgi:hypothetical protein